MHVPRIENKNKMCVVVRQEQVCKLGAISQAVVQINEYTARYCIYNSRIIMAQSE